jgi:hypothetical protein
MAYAKNENKEKRQKHFSQKKQNFFKELYDFALLIKYCGFQVGYLKQNKILFE